MTLPKPITPLTRQLSDFEGHWALRKEICHAKGKPAQFAGQAVWTPEGDGLAYVETGKLTMADGAAFTAQRRYLWTPPLTVHFDDGRFFHQVPPGGGAALHDCPPDTYRVTYDFKDWPRWSALWQVTGPRKDYVMRCDYTR